MKNKTKAWGIGTFLLFPLFVFLWNKLTVQKNDVNPEIFKSYFDNIQKIEVNYREGDDQFSGKTKSYKTGTNIYFATAKARFGEFSTEVFKDSASQKYFALYFFDEDIFYTKSFTISRELHRQPFYVWVNKEDFENHSFGTKQNPYPVFKYRGQKEPFSIPSHKEDEEGNIILNEKGESIHIDRNIEPTEEEYKYYVINYLAYAMPKEEFKRRFSKKNQ